MKISINSTFDLPDTGGHYPIALSKRDALIENLYHLVRQGLNKAREYHLAQVAEPNNNPAMQKALVASCKADLAIWQAFVDALDISAVTSTVNSAGE